MTTGTWTRSPRWSNPHGDIAIGYHPDTFEEVGGFYGAYIGAEIGEELAPYISGRIDDNQTESKRYELFRLPEADGEKTVRFRIATSGTWSWYWGIDNFGLYSIAPSSMPEVVEASPAAGSQGANPMPLMTFVIKNGEAKLDPGSVKLEFNGSRCRGHHRVGNQDRRGGWPSGHLSGDRTAGGPLR